MRYGDDMAYDKNVKELVILRLKAVPSNLSISIGGHGEFTRDQLIEEVKKGSEVGEAAVRMELLFIRQMPQLAKRLSQH